ncbi:MAG: ATP-dependent 6-phosphofructokinase [Myxococcales bacterium]|nr:ATP-dependent 6-phosphofructokinase [Myxococcales bacterium]
MKVCVLTGGGDAPGLNAVLRGFAKRASQLGIEAWGSPNGFEGLVFPDVALERLDAHAVRGILPRGGSILGCSNKANPFAMPVPGEKGKTRDESAAVVERIKGLGIDALVLVGGDGTMHYARRFITLGLPCVGVPKTIDNDLGGTDQTFGFETAVNTASWAIDTLHSTAEAHERVMILEVMGRNAGWIALSAGLAGGADVILIPEIPYDLDRVIAKIKARAEAGSPFTIVVVAEGAFPRGETTQTVEAEARPGQLLRVGGAGERLRRLLEGRIDHETRVTVLGHLQRGGSPSAYDRVLGMRMGIHAADLCARSAFGRLVVLRGTTIASVSLDEVPDAPRLVEPDGQLANVARAMDVELGA